MVQRNLTPGDKNGADINRARRSKWRSRAHQRFVIVGGDSDFISLVEKLAVRQVFIVGGRRSRSSCSATAMSSSRKNLSGAGSGVAQSMPAAGAGRRAAGTAAENAPIEQAIPLVTRRSKCCPSARCRRSSACSRARCCSRLDVLERSYGRIVPRLRQSRMGVVRV
jgi:hypothetical protein